MAPEEGVMGTSGLWLVRSTSDNLGFELGSELESLSQVKGSDAIPRQCQMLLNCRMPSQYPLENWRIS